MMLRPTLWRAQGEGSGARTRPQGMPERVPPNAPRRPAKAPDVLPAQQPIDDTPVAQPPARWKAVAKKLGLALLIALALAAVYLFLLLGEPDEDDQLTAQAVQTSEPIRVPMAAMQASGDADVNSLAANFGEPVLALYGGELPLQKAELFDTAFEGGYARRVTLTSAFADGLLCTAESLRPAGASRLLGGSGFHLDGSGLNTLAGLDAVRIQSGSVVCVVAQNEAAAYAVTCPTTHVAELSALLKQTTLMQPTAVQ